MRFRYSATQTSGNCFGRVTAMTPEVFTVNELMARWKCSRDVLYDMFGRKELWAFKVGRDYRIPKAEVERYERGE